MQLKLAGITLMFVEISNAGSRQLTILNKNRVAVDAATVTGLVAKLRSITRVAVTLMEAIADLQVIRIKLICVKVELQPRNEVPIEIKKHRKKPTYSLSVTVGTLLRRHVFDELTFLIDAHLLEG